MYIKVIEVDASRVSHGEYLLDVSEAPIDGLVGFLATGVLPVGDDREFWLASMAEVEKLKEIIKKRLEG